MRSSPEPVTAAARAITIQATTAKTHSDGPMRRTRSRTVVQPPRREADAANRLPDTKNMTGMAASTVTTAAPVACHTTTLISAAARRRSRPRSRAGGSGRAGTGSLRADRGSGTAGALHHARGPGRVGGATRAEGGSYRARHRPDPRGSPRRRPALDCCSAPSTAEGRDGGA